MTQASVSDYYVRHWRKRVQQEPCRPDASWRDQGEVRLLVEHGKGLETILDMGCGIGLWRDVVARHFPHASYHGVEFSPYLCERFGWERGSVVDYRALVSAPEETVRQVYSDIGLEPGAAFAARLALEQGKVREHETAHSYSLEEFGLHSEEIHAQLEDLFLRFGWPRPTPQKDAGEHTA